MQHSPLNVLASGNYKAHMRRVDESDELHTVHLESHGRAGG